MAINLVTGQPRNGKSQRMIAKVMDHYIKENDKREKNGQPRRKIYIDIDGVNAPNTPTHLKDCITEFEQEKIWFGEHDDPERPDGHWCPEYGSIFIFDECHKRSWVKDTSGSVSKIPTTISLNEHGHAGHDIELLTQFPQYIHTHIRGLIQEHWHVKRIMKLTVAKVYKWDEYIPNPRAERVFESAYEVETFKFKKKYERAYKSASAHAPISFQFPKKLILPLLALAIILVLLYHFGKDSIFAKHIKEQENQQVTQQTQSEIEQIRNQNQQQLEQINQMRLELEELKRKYLPKHIATLAAYEDVRPAMVISNENGCISYNTYGEPLLLTDSLCQQMSDHPAMIPRSRQVKEVSAHVNKGQSDGIFGNTQAKTQSQDTNIKYFDHTKDFR